MLVCIHGDGFLQAWPQGCKITQIHAWTSLAHSHSPTWRRKASRRAFSHSDSKFGFAWRHFVDSHNLAAGRHARSNTFQPHSRTQRITSASSMAVRQLEAHAVNAGRDAGQGLLTSGLVREHGCIAYTEAGRRSGLVTVSAKGRPSR